MADTDCTLHTVQKETHTGEGVSYDQRLSLSRALSNPHVRAISLANVHTHYICFLAVTIQASAPLRRLNLKLVEILLCDFWEILLKHTS
jgi:hypothetical protein